MKNSKYTRPPLRWAGGNQRILSRLLPHIEGSGRLIEPFVGAGSVFTAAGERDIIINDANADLIEFYQCLKRDVNGYIEAAAIFFTEAHKSVEAYVANRDRFNKSESGVERAALLLYLNKFGFNGLYRVNKRNSFNVPYGHPKKLPEFPRLQLLEMAAKLQKVQIQHGDFTAAIALASAGDVVYCDPPYADASVAKRSFTAYTSDSFSWQQQQQLVDVSHAAVARGATVVISNHDNEVTRALYKGAEIHSFDVRRSVAADGEARTAARELIAVFRPSAVSRSTACQSIPTKDAVEANIPGSNSNSNAAAGTEYFDIFELSEVLGISVAKLRALGREEGWRLPPPANFGSNIGIVRWRAHEVSQWMVETGFSANGEH